MLAPRRVLSNCAFIRLDLFSKNWCNRVCRKLWDCNKIQEYIHCIQGAQQSIGRFVEIEVHLIDEILDPPLFRLNTIRTVDSENNGGKTNSTVKTSWNTTLILTSQLPDNLNELPFILAYLDQFVRWKTGKNSADNLLRWMTDRSTVSSCKIHYLTRTFTVFYRLKSDVNCSTILAVIVRKYHMSLCILRVFMGTRRARNKGARSPGSVKVDKKDWFKVSGSVL